MQGAWIEVSTGSSRSRRPAVAPSCRARGLKLVSKSLRHSHADGRTLMKGAGIEIGFGPLRSAPSALRVQQNEVLAVLTAWDDVFSRSGAVFPGRGRVSSGVLPRCRLGCEDSSCQNLVFAAHRLVKTCSGVFFRQLWGQVGCETAPMTIARRLRPALTRLIASCGRMIPGDEIHVRPSMPDSTAETVIGAVSRPTRQPPANPPTRRRSASPPSLAQLRQRSLATTRSCRAVNACVTGEATAP